MNICEIQEVKDEVSSHLPEGYEIKCWTAEGSIGNIYTVNNPITKKCLAVKTVKTNYNRSYFAKIKQEFAIQKLLNHDNIASVFGCKETGIYTIICMELLTGGDLFDLIPFGKGMNVKKGFFIYKEILSAVEFCHERYIVHMDIKPENIMMSHGGKPKLIDFGIAVNHKAMPYINHYLGTLPYSAPETFLSRPYTGYKADIFSLNITFLTVVTGERCWSRAVEEDAHYMDWNMHNWNLEIFKRIPTDMLNFLMLALADDPEKRLSIEQIRAHYWFQSAAKGKYKALKSPTKVASDRDQHKSQPMAANLRAILGSYEVPMSQPSDLSSILMPELSRGEQIVKRMSRFLSGMSISDTLHVLLLVLGQMQHCTIVSSSSNGLTVEAAQSGFCVTFRVFVYPLGESMLVDFRRVKGDGLLFREVFASVRETSADLGLVATDYDCLRMVQPPLL